MLLGGMYGVVLSAMHGALPVTSDAHDAHFKSRFNYVISFI